MLITQTSKQIKIMTPFNSRENKNAAGKRKVSTVYKRLSCDQCLQCLKNRSSSNQKGESYIHACVCRGCDSVPGASTGVPTHDKVMQERPDGQGESGLKSAPAWTSLSIYPKTKICLFHYFTTFTNSSDVNGGLSLTTFLCKKINLKLQLISLLGIIGLFQFKPL